MHGIIPCAFCSHGGQEKAVETLALEFQGESTCVGWESSALHVLNH